MTAAVIGGVFIGAAAVWLLLSVGRVAGISGIVSSALTGVPWAILFILGLGIGGWIAIALAGAEFGEGASVTPFLIVGGLLVGIGTRVGSGCTSGHGVCGVARLSLRSVVATVVFVGVGMLTATLVHAL